MCCQSKEQDEHFLAHKGQLLKDDTLEKEAKLGEDRGLEALTAVEALLVKVFKATGESTKESGLACTVTGT